MEKLIHFFKDNIILTTGIGLCAFAFGVQQYRRKYMWKEVGYLKTIYIHTLKSGKGLSVESADCFVQGPNSNGNQDRVFAVYFEETNTVQSVRQKLTKIVLVSISRHDDNTWKIAGDGVEPCFFREPEHHSPEVSQKFLEISLEGLDCGDEAADWLSKFLGGRVRLMKNLPEQQDRRVARPKYLKLYPSTFNSSCTPVYGDVTSFMMTSDASLRDLNAKAAVPISQRSFRPNFVVDGYKLAPWEEDEWTGQVRIGDVVFNYSKDCTRCYFTRTNPENGDQLPENEPLQTLKQFRQHDRSHKNLRKALGDSPIFGMHYGLAPGQPGTVRVGDRVWVRRTGPIVAL